MSVQLKRFNRRFHFWAALLVFLPLCIVIGSGLLLQVKKELPWVQPPTIKGASNTPLLTFEQILHIAQKVPQADIKTWRDIEVIDTRPAKGVIKIRSTNHWELQLDAQSGQLLSSAFRRSDIIESIHDGTFFHKHARLWLFLPAAVVLFFMWISGGYMLIPNLIHKYQRRRNRTNKLHSDEK